MREWKNFTYIPNTSWVASKNEEHFIKNCFLFFPFPQWLLTQSLNIYETNKMIFLIPKDLNWEWALAGPKSESCLGKSSWWIIRVANGWKSPSNVHLLGQEEENVVFMEEIKPRTSFTMNHAPPQGQGHCHPSPPLPLTAREAKAGQGRANLTGRWLACVFVDQAVVKAPNPGSQGHILPEMIFFPLLFFRPPLPHP